jgi:hypothetical protein
MAINDPRCTTVYQMWNTWNIQATETREHILAWTSVVARGAPGGKLRHLVIHCHGSPGSMMLGQGFDLTTVGQFSALRDCVNVIWLHVCSVGGAGTGNADGIKFCSAMAKAARCVVVASENLQYHLKDHTYPPDQMDAFEGLLHIWDPNGNLFFSWNMGDWASNKE